MRDFQRHVAAEGGSYKLAIRNIICHLDTCLSDEQKAAINWHAGQSVSLAVMRLISIESYRALGEPETVAAVDPVAANSHEPSTCESNGSSTLISATSPTGEE